MKILVEKTAEPFLKKEGFKVINSIIIKERNEIPSKILPEDFPIVMKVSGKRILHKNKIGGVKVGIRNYKTALTNFDLLMKIKNSEEVIVQKQISGDEFLLGIKYTNEFGHVLAFGIGGVKVEQMKKVAFRACPLNRKEISGMIKEVVPKIKRNYLKKIRKNILKLSKLSKKYPNIRELDINPLIVDKKQAIVVDARILFD
jgi:acetyltransferase